MRGEKTDERSDLFALGVMIYEALRGEKPFPHRTYHELLQAMSDETAFEAGGVPAKFFEKSPASKPKARFASASEMKRSLTNAVAGLQN